MFRSGYTVNPAKSVIVDRPGDPRGQGPEQGDRDFAERHPVGGDPQTMPGVSTFDVLNDASDVIMAIATGNGGQNPAPYTAHSDRPGLAGEPAASPGYPVPAPQDIGFNPGRREFAVVTKSPGDAHVGNSPSSYSALAAGAAQVAGGTGATASSAEPVDVSLPPVTDFPAPAVPARDPWLPSIDGYDGRIHSRPSVTEPSPTVPAMYDPQLGVQNETV